MLIKIPSSYLYSLLNIAATKDIRYYLAGVHLTESRLEASDGHIASVIEAVIADEKINIIIDRTCLDSFYKVLKPKQRLDEILTIDTDNNTISCCGFTSELKLFDCAYPDIKRIEKNATKSGVDVFAIDAELLFKINKAHKIITGDKKSIVKMSFTGSSDSVILCECSNKFIKSYIMPYRQ